MRRCAFCDGKAQFRDTQAGQPVCLEHARLRVVAAQQKTPVKPLAIRPATTSDAAHVEALALHFWDETEVDCFDRQFDVLDCPAFVACEGQEVVGLAPYALAPELDALILVIFNVLPEYQGRGAGRALLDAICNEARRRNIGQVIVATTNDDLPALALYQRYGFRITKVIPGGVAEHHGGAFPGFAGIPVRDEIRLAHGITHRS